MNQDLRNAFLKKGGILQTKDLRQLLSEDTRIVGKG